MDAIYIPVSIGEIFDKISILKIKQEKIKDQNKLILIEKEMFLLMNCVEKLIQNDTDNKLQEKINNITTINKKLWDIEDKIREKEKDKQFDNEFISLARMVYITNDDRFRVKNEINNMFSSEIKEVKSYSSY